MYRLAFNPTPGPVVSDDEGRTIAGGEWGPVDSTSTAVRSAVDAGRLVLQDVPADDVADTSSNVRDAAREVAVRIERREALDPLDREALTELARARLGPDAELPTTKAELIARMVPLGIVPAEAPAEEPAPPARATRARKEEG